MCNMFSKLFICFLIQISLNGFHAEDIHSFTGPENNSTIEDKTQNDKSSTEVPKTIPGDTTTIAKQENDATTSAIVKDTEQNVLRDEFTESDEIKNQIKRKSLYEHTNVRPTVTTESQTKGLSEKDLHIDNVVENLLNKPDFQFRADEPANIVPGSGSETTLKRPGSSYLSRLTGSMILPALKARQTLSGAITKQTQGIKEFGSGTYNAAVGTFKFFKDATTAVMKS